MLVTSNFSFSHNVSYHSPKKIRFFFFSATFILLSASAFNLEMYENLAFGKELKYMFQSPYSATILQNMLCLFLKDFPNLKVT